MKKCGLCKGSGISKFPTITNNPCQVCGGSGEIPDGYVSMDVSKPLGEYIDDICGNKHRNDESTKIEEMSGETYTNRGIMDKINELINAVNNLRER
jgi:hypothetical protein